MSCACAISPGMPRAPEVLHSEDDQWISGGSVVDGWRVSRIRDRGLARRYFIDHYVVLSSMNVQAPFQKGNRIMLRLEHANIIVRNIDEAVRFVRTAFPEFEIRHEGDDGGRRWVHVGTDDTYLCFTQASKEPAERWEPYTGKPGVNHLGFEVEDVEKVRERLAAAGFRDSTYPNQHPHRRRVYFNDAEGNDWEFVQYLSSDPAERNDYTLAG